jgi:hypothetical protein
VHQRVDKVLEDRPVRDTPTVATQRVVGMELSTWWQQRGELDPDRFQQR